MFAAQIASAIQGKDADFFLRDPVVTSIECSAGGPCPIPGPTVVVGIRYGLWRSDGFVSSVADTRSQLVDLLSSGRQLAAIAEATTDPLYGDALQPQPGHFAVMNDPDDPGWVTLLDFLRDGSNWRLEDVVNARTTDASTNEWLSGRCSECYDYWEPWQGATN
jgi:hypothetical protein